ncbi:RBR-type E3 ubiquitin transferase [Caerostris extrusa]|uniref:RBR-type E3 ubiquitin transferase n=1 Tax=Caerostris extrusa TaxID=172846 RepID=A0AAV4UPI7_CAEEX|nr:RBR-type E3 ubiquitin transferase [Caerostris extrusa]
MIHQSISVSIQVTQGETIDNSNLARNPWNVQRTNISSPIQVSIPSSSPDMMTNGQSFGYPLKPQSRSIADLSGAPTNPIGPHPYHLPHYPYMHPHPPVHPQQYSHSMTHMNCAQCLSSSWSNLMSPHPSPYFHPMPWGSAQGSLARGQAPPTSNGHLRHSHGNLPAYPDPNFHYPYPGPYFANGAPMVDPNFVRDLHQQADGSKVSKSPSKQALSTESMDTTPANLDGDGSNAEEEIPFENRKRTKSIIDEGPPEVPPPPSTPWSCMHCTFVNPPGIHICQVCCKTSYKVRSSPVPDDQIGANRVMDSESPMELVNLDAISKSPLTFQNLEHKR